MPKVIVADGCHQVDSPLSGTRYYARGARALEGTVRGGVFDMSPADAAMAVRMGGAIASEAGVTSRRVGFRCTGCGFGSYTVTCGRCAAECRREGVREGAVPAAAVADPPA